MNLPKSGPIRMNDEDGALRSEQDPSPIRGPTPAGVRGQAPRSDSPETRAIDIDHEEGPRAVRLQGVLTFEHDLSAVGREVAGVVFTVLTEARIGGHPLEV